MKRSNQKLNKIQKIDQKIEQMLKEKEEILQKTYKTIGETVTKEWGTYDLDDILFAIKELKPNALQMLIPLENIEDDPKDTDNNSSSQNTPVVNN